MTGRSFLIPIPAEERTITMESQLKLIQKYGNRISAAAGNST
jgi:hypothetical protein